MGYDPYKVAQWYHQIKTRSEFVALCVNEHNMKVEAAEDYWKLCDAVIDLRPPAAIQGAPAEQSGEAHVVTRRTLVEGQKPPDKVRPCIHWIPGATCMVFLNNQCGKKHSCIISAQA